jgi:hypothetical protein
MQMSSRIWEMTLRYLYQGRNKWSLKSTIELETKNVCADEGQQKLTQPSQQATNQQSNRLKE